MDEISLTVAILSLFWAILWGVYTHFKNEKNKRGKVDSKIKSARIQQTTIQKHTPSIWHVPHSKNIHFTGREDLILRLRNSLTSTGGKYLPQAICGMSGVGKTQLVIEYLYRYEAEYDTIIWINAQDPTILASDYTNLANLLNLNIKEDADQSLIRERIREWFRLHNNWLLIFDNVEQPKDVFEYLPQVRSGHILITSRNKSWREIATPVELTEWSVEESITFLEKRTGKQDKINALKISKELGCLPLALAQAAAYIDAKKKSFSEYLVLFTTKRKQLWEKEDPPLDYPLTISTTWNLAITLVKEEAPAGAEILNLCAFLAAENIPRSFMTEIPIYFVESEIIKNDEISIDKAIEILNRYSLINAKENTLSVHRLIQQVIRDYLEIDSQKQWCKTAIKLIEKKFPSNALRNVTCWPQCVDLLTHAQVAIKNAIKLKIALSEATILLNKVSLYFYARKIDNTIKEAIQLYRDFVKILESQSDVRLEDLSLNYNNLGVWLREQGDFDEAEFFLSEALKIRESLDSESTLVAQTLHNLGQFFHLKEKYREAESYIRRSLKIYELHSNRYIPDVAMCLNSLGILLYHQKKHVEAEKILRRSLKIRESIDSAYPELAESFYYLALILHAQAKNLEAEPYIRRSLEIYEVQLDLNHKSIVDAMKILISILDAQGQHLEAKEYYHRLLLKAENSLGTNHSITRSLLKFKDRFSKMGEYSISPSQI